MRKTGSRRFGAIAILALALIIVFSVGTLTACNNDEGTVKELSVVEDSLKGYYVVGEFDITSIMLNVTYEDDTVNPISVSKSMITTADANSLKEAGEKNITVKYRGKSIVLTFTLVDDGAQIACVTFHDKGGKDIVKKYTLVGGSIEAPTAPEIEGQRFEKWVDSSGNAAVLTNVQNSIDYYPTYSNLNESCVVNFHDFDGSIITSASGSSKVGTTISSGPSLDMKKHPEIKSYTWNVEFPYVVSKSVEIYPVVKYNTCAVFFTYAYESSAGTYITVESCSASVTYGESVSEQAKRMETELAKLGLEIVTKPNVPAKVEKTGALQLNYIVRDASVSIKVYQDQDKKQQITSFASPAKIGAEIELPDSNSAVSVSGMVFRGWKITGSNGSVNVTDRTWVVTKAYGLSVEITPFYDMATVPTSFEFCFNTLSGDNYSVILAINDKFSAESVVTYQYIDNLLKNINENAQDYITLLGGNSVTSSSVETKNVTEGGVTSLRESVLKNDIGYYGIVKIEYNDGEALEINGSVPVGGNGISVIINLARFTKGLVFVASAEGDSYYVTGLDDTYVTGTNIYIPSTYNDKPVVKIGNNAFNGKYISKLSDNLTEIGKEAFKGSTLYGNIDVSQVKSLGESAFENASVVADVIAFSVLETMDVKAFAGTKFYPLEENATITVNLGTKIVEVSEDAFKNASGLGAVILAETVTKVSDYAFYETGIRSISNLNNVKEVGQHAFEGTALTDIVLPAVTSIGGSAFVNMTELTTLTVSNIEADAARDSEGFTFYIDMLEGSVNIGQLNIGSGVKDIAYEDASLFATFTKLTAINVAHNRNMLSHEGVLYFKSEDASVGTSYMLAYYPNAKTGNYRPEVPTNDTVKIEAAAFMNSTVVVLDLTGVKYEINDGGLTADNVYAVVIGAKLDGNGNVETDEGGNPVCDEAVKAKVEQCFPNANVVAVTSQSAYGYLESEQLVYKFVTVGEGDNAVTTVSVIAGSRNATSITVPAQIEGKNVSAIENYAFAGYTELKTLTVQATLSGWSNTILNGCTALSEFTVKGWAKGYTPALGDFAGNAWYDARNVIVIGGVPVGYNNASAKTTVSADEAAVYFGDTIPKNFFANANITSIALPSAIKTLGEGAFAGSALEEFTAEGLTYVGKEAFKNCVYLKDITLNFVGTQSVMYGGVFLGCTGLSSATITGEVNASVAAGVTYYSLAEQTFKGCTSLSTVNLGKINNLKGEAFHSCNSLTEFDFSSIIGKEIPAHAFAYTGIRYAILSSAKLTTIGQEAFSNCQALEYVQLGSTVTTVGVNAFVGVNAKFVVELAYSTGGLYNSTANVDESAFDDDTTFFISQMVDVSEINFLQGKDADKVKSTYPRLSFSVTEDTSTELQFSMSDVANQILFVESDLIAATFAGYSFAGWYEKADGSGNPIEFPYIVRKDTTVYAKYYNERQGSVKAETDVKYVYYISDAPAIELDSGESVTWAYIKNGEAEKLIYSFPFIVEASNGDTFILKGRVYKDGDFVYSKAFEGCGTLGYALVKYSGTNASTMIIPDNYDDGINGLHEVIVIFAGAFKEVMSSEFVIPLGVKAIFAGSGEVNMPIDEFDDTTGTFKSDLKKVVIPAGVEYIGDGVFAGANIEDIRFVEGSNLLYATENAFKGSAWWAKQIENAGTTNGFIIAGRLAVKYIGTAKVYSLNSEDDKVFVTTNKSGFAETTGAITVNIRIYDANYNYTDKVVTVYADSEMANGKVYKYTINIGEDVTIIFAVNSDNTGWSYASGKNILFLQKVPAGTVAVALGAIEDAATIPSGIIKLNDAIFRGMKDIDVVTLNKDLEIIGDEAFKNSGLTTLKYGANDNEQYVSAISTIGKNAFEGTDLYKKEKVIVGAIFLKYNHVGNMSISINESVVKIASGAFRGITNLNSVNIGSTTLKEIEAYAFKNCNVKSITVPGSLDKIGMGAFENCAALIALDLSKTALTEIGDKVFSGDKELTSLSLPAGVKTIGNGALSGCVALTTLTAAGISHLDVAAGSFASGLDDTKWYNPTEASGSATDDVVLMLGTVLVKYILGTKAKSVYEKDGAYTVNIANGVTEIAFNAFNGNYLYITDVVLPDTVKEIGAYAFANTGIKTVKFGTGLEVIRDHAFYNSAALKTAILPEGLKEIDDYAFAGTSLTTEICNAKGERVEDPGYTIPDSVTAVGERAFSGVNTLTVINLGVGLVDIGEGAFDTISGKTTSNFYKVNWNLSIDKTEANESGDPIAPIAVLQNNLAAKDDGAHAFGKSLFKTSADKNIRFYATEAICDYIELNYTGLWVTSGEDEGYGWAFYTNGTLPSVTPDNDGYSVPIFNTEYIKEGDLVVPLHSTVSGSTFTFMYWELVNEEDDSTTPIQYPYLVTKDVHIKAKFYENEVNGSAVPGDANKITGTDVSGTTFIAESTTHVGVGQVASIISVDTDNDELYVPNTVYNVKITSFAVSNNTTIKKMVITFAENFNGMSDNIFRGFTALENIEINNAGYNEVDFKVVPVELSATYIANSTTKTHKDTFYVLYSNDTAAGSGYGSKLIAVIGNVAAATQRARDEGYEGTADLEFVFEVPEGVTEIYSYAFVNSGFAKVTLPSTLTTIGDNAFGDSLKELKVSDKINLTNVTRDAISEGAPIWNSAVPETSGGYITLKGLQSASASGSFYAIANVLVGYKSQITEYMSSEGFALPTTVNGINITVLATCINWTGSDINIKTIVFPTNLERINNDAFSQMNFQNITNADNYANLTYIANNVFNGTTYYNGSGALYVGKVLVRWQNASGDITLKSDTVAIASNAMSGASITGIEIPGKVVSIGDTAFFACPQLKKVIIPNSVTTIGDNAFRKCISLNTVEISTVDSMLYSVGDGAFAGDTALVSIQLPYSLYKLGASVFSGCTALKTITFDGYKGDQTIDETKLSNLSEIGKEAFNGATNLEEIKIPKSVKVISSQTFENCSGLVNIDFETGSILEVIEDSAFQNCYKLGSKLDPENLDLYTVNLPDSLVTVGAKAFYGCKGMWGITFGCNIDSLGSELFTGCMNLVKVEIRRATAPTITNTTFETSIVDDGITVLANYRLRVYVQADYNGNVIKSYKDKWESEWTECAGHIYDRVTKPTVTLVPGNGAASRTLEGDVFLSSTLNQISFNGAAYLDWKYSEFTLSGTTGEEENDYSATRRADGGKSYKKYGSQYIGGEKELYVLIIDYDNITMRSEGVASET